MSDSMIKIPARVYGLKHIVSKDVTRYGFDCVRLMPTFAEATDGHFAVRLQYTEKEREHIKEHNVGSDGMTIKILSGTPKRRPKVETDGKWGRKTKAPHDDDGYLCLLRVDGYLIDPVCLFNAEVTDVSFPDVGSVIETSEGGEHRQLGVSVDLLTRLSKCVGSSKRMVIDVPEVEFDPYRIKTRGDGSVLALVMPMRVD